MKRDKLTTEQRELFFQLSIMQQEVVMRVLEGMTWKEAYENAPDTMFDQSKNGWRAMQRSRPVKLFMNSVRDMAELDDRIMTRNEALRILTRQARASIQDVIQFKDKFIGMAPDGSGPMWMTQFGIRRLCDLDPEKVSAISEISEGVNGTKIKMYNAKQSIDTLSRMQGWDATQKVQSHLIIDDETKEMLKTQYQSLREDMLTNDDC